VKVGEGGGGKGDVPKKLKETVAFGSFVIWYVLLNSGPFTLSGVVIAVQFPVYTSPGLVSSIRAYFGIFNLGSVVEVKFGYEN
jgi:hypothetical protein